MSNQKKSTSRPATLRIRPQQKTQKLSIESTAFPGQSFHYVIPEAIGSSDMAVWGAAPDTLMAPDWTQTSDGGWTYSWRKEGWLEFSAHAQPGEDYLDVRIRLKNLSNTAWPESLSFSCFSPRAALDFADFDGSRTFLLIDGQWKPITQIERKDSNRPTIQLWYLKNGPKPLGFVEHFQATPPVYPEAVLAVRSYDGKHVVAVTADKPLFLFGNLEFSCIHCCPSFGALKPGEEGVATHRVFICRDTSLDQLADKVRATVVATPKTDNISIEPLINPPGGVMHSALIRAPWMAAPVQLRFPETLSTDSLDFIDHHRPDMIPRVPSAPLATVWKKNADGSLSFEWTFDNQSAGGSLKPNKEDVDLEFWLENRRDRAVQLALQLCAVLTSSIFEDRTLERSWIHTAGKWKRMSETNRGGGKRELCHYPIKGGPEVGDAGDWGGSPELVDAPVAAATSPDSRYVFGISFAQPRSIVSNTLIPCLHADPVAPPCPPGGQAKVRGKLYLLEGTLDDLLARVRRDTAGPR